MIPIRLGDSNSSTKRKKSKYGNKRVVDANGEVFDSIAEYERWQVLRSFQARGEIAGLKRQVYFELAPSVVIDGRKRPALRYVADFVYTDRQGVVIVEDVKGHLTDVYKIKRHLMMSEHGIEIREIKKNR